MEIGIRKIKSIEKKEDQGKAMSEQEKNGKGEKIELE